MENAWHLRGEMEFFITCLSVSHRPVNVSPFHSPQLPPPISGYLEPIVSPRLWVETSKYWEGSGGMATSPVRVIASGNPNLLLLLFNTSIISELIQNETTHLAYITET